MTDSNRCRVSVVREITLGTTPTTPTMRIARITGEGLRYAPQFVNSDEIRADRMSADPTKVNETNAGPINFELFYPQPRSALSEMLVSAMLNDWVNTPEWDNDQTADSVITGVTATTGTFAIVDQSGSGGFAGTSVKAGHLIRSTGFANANNNTVRKVTSATATTIVVGASILTDEAAPPAGARIKVVGFEGASGDITATASGLASTTLDFTTLGLSVGQWIKIGGSATSNQFATTACNGWARITAIAAHALTLDNLPSGWTTDTGTGKTIRVFFGDLIKNGTTLYGLSIERSFLGQAAPTHIIQRGMCGNSLRLDFASERIITGAVEFIGLSGSQGTSANGSTYAAAPTGTAMAANASVGRIAEGGVTVASPNWVRTAGISLANNLRTQTAVGTVGAVGIGMGECEVTVSLESYFGSNALYQKLLAGTPTSVNLRSTQNSQAVIADVPRLTLTDGSPNAAGKNQDVTLGLTGRASYDSTMMAHLIINRLEYYEV